jgi:hypothetical protein
MEIHARLAVLHVKLATAVPQHVLFAVPIIKKYHQGLALTSARTSLIRFTSAIFCVFHVIRTVMDALVIHKTVLTAI